MQIQAHIPVVMVKLVYYMESMIIEGNRINGSKILAKMQHKVIVNEGNDNPWCYY